MLLVLMTSLFVPLAEQQSTEATILGDTTDTPITTSATTPQPQNPEVTATLDNEANTSIVAANKSSAVGTPIETDAQEETIPTITQETIGSLITVGDRWADDGGYSKWNSTNETDNTNWVLNHSFILDLDNYNISAANLNYIHWTIRSFVEGVNPDTTGKIRLWNVNDGAWDAPGWTLSNSEQEFTANYTDPEVVVDTNNQVEINTLVNDSTDTNYNYTVDQALVTVGYHHNITVDKLDFRQGQANISVERSSWTKDLTFSMNASFSSLNYMNFSIYISHSEMDRFTNFELYNGTSEEWIDLDTVENFGSAPSTWAGGTLVANLSNSVSSGEILRLTIPDVQMPTFEEEQAGDVVWQEDKKKRTVGQRERTYKVKNPDTLTFENIAWEIDIPTDAVTEAIGGNTTSSLVIPGQEGNTVTDVVITYRSAGTIVVKARDDITKQALEGGEITVIGPASKQYAKGDFDDGSFTATTLPPGDYTVDVSLEKWGTTYSSSFDVELEYNEMQSKAVTFTAPPWWFILLIVALIGSVIALIVAVVMQRRRYT